ncbi:MAG: alanine racemase [Syntrophomonadaceae bacterium]|nr:alanine racemase [Syntrophomonadaceae bacterium]
MSDSAGYDKWIEVDAAAVAHNYRQVATRLQAGVKLIAVLKADAYGQGAVEMARLLAEGGTDFFAVTHLEEALKLRRGGIDGDILLFLPLRRREDVRVAAEQRLTVSVGSTEDIEALAAAGEEELPALKVHLQVDTGLGRFGFLDQETLLTSSVRLRVQGFDLEGIYTHMADAAGDAAYTRRQFARFMELTQALDNIGIELKYRHCANSAAMLNYPEMQLDAVRVGTLLSGQHPVGSFSPPLDLREPFRFMSRIISLHRLPQGSYLGYYKTHRLRRDALIGVIPVGYRDGLLLEVANPPAGAVDLIKTMLRPLLYRLGRGRFRHTVKCQGQEWPLRGKVFMQTALIEFPPDAPIRLGDEVEVPMRKVLSAAGVPHVYVNKS